MVAYWTRRVEGHRFLRWANVFFGSVTLALLLLRPHRLDGYAYFAMAMCSVLLVENSYRLWKGSPSDAYKKRSAE